MSDKQSKRTASDDSNSNIDILELSNWGLVYLLSMKHIQYEHLEVSGMHDDKRQILKID